MSFTSIYFVFFIIALLLVYWLTPKKWNYYVILIFSVAFFVLCDWKSIFFILFSGLATYFLSNYITKNLNEQKEYIQNHKADLSLDDKKTYKAKKKKERKRALVINILISVILLAVMKYLDFMIGNINSLLQLFNIDFSLPLCNWFLPLGISFYTFQIIAYIVDVYWGRFEAEKNPFKFFTFLFYFPKIMQGPIVRYEEMKDELFIKKEFDYNNFTDGLKRMGYGYLKKMVVADTLMVFVNYAFSNVSSLSGCESLLAIIFYFMQDYCDFSGYMDIAIGVSLMIGVKLPENFNHPYFAVNIDDYWRRWHITLGTWFKDYIFYPLSLSKLSMNIGKQAKKVFPEFGKKVPAIFGLAIVWFLTGLWHGASWNYVVWGLFYGLIIVLEIVLEPLYKKLYSLTKIKKDAWFMKVYRHIKTIIILAFGRCLFMASTLADGVTIFAKAFTFFDFEASNLNNQLGYISVITAIVGIIPVIIIDIIQECHPETTFLDKFRKVPLPVRWILYISMVLFIIWFGYYGSGLPKFEFGYTQF